MLLMYRLCAATPTNYDSAQCCPQGSFILNCVQEPISAQLVNKKGPSDPQTIGGLMSTKAL